MFFPLCYLDPLTLGCLVRYPKVNRGSRLSPPRFSRSTQNDHPTCGELAVGPAIMPRTIRPHFGLTFSPTLLVSRGGSDGWSLSIFSHAEATGKLSAGTVCTGLLLCGGLLDDTKLPSISPSTLSCLQKRDSSIKTTPQVESLTTLINSTFTVSSERALGNPAVTSNQPALYR